MTSTIELVTDAKYGDALFEFKVDMVPDVADCTLNKSLRSLYYFCEAI